MRRPLSRCLGVSIFDALDEPGVLIAKGGPA
jgi:hypothetical protein